MRASIAYSLARLGVFAACLGLGWLVGLRDPLVLLLVAATVSMLLSLFFLARLRDKFSVDVANRIEERRSRKHTDEPAAARGKHTPSRSTTADAEVEDEEADSFR
ncbi:MAG: DUF4229 domain-containing protein [Dermatophilus congolensis]|nr:DUF4229 domain-containing protein [Dermatophilus congolensis]